MAKIEITYYLGETTRAGGVSIHEKTTTILCYSPFKWMLSLCLNMHEGTGTLEFQLWGQVGIKRQE